MADQHPQQADSGEGHSVPRDATSSSTHAGIGIQGGGDAFGMSPRAATGRSSTAPLPPPAAALPQDKTVLSARPPAPETPVLPRAPGVFELGRMLEGKRLGHFQLEHFVGGGGMGAVFRAIDTRLSRTVAVKVLSRDRTDEDTLRRFQNEAQSAARLDHPNIARVYYVGEDEGLNYIVFEYIEGVNIRDLVALKGPLPLDEAVNYTLQLAEAIDHASLRDVVHRDIKPSNVLVMSNGHVKLVDMGLARLHQVEASNADLTATGVTLGTFDYISPEQARDPRSADVRSDLYSLGCTLYYMLTGRPPFPEGTVLQKLLSHSSDPPPDVRVLRPDLGDEVNELLQRLLAKQPSRRFQQPRELIGALLLLADELGLEKVARTGQVWVAEHAGSQSLVERQLPWALPLAVLVAVVLGMQWATPRVRSSAAAPSRPVFPTLSTGSPLTPGTVPRTPNAPVEAPGRASPASPPHENGGAEMEHGANLDPPAVNRAASVLPSTGGKDDLPLAPLDPALLADNGPRATSGAPARRETPNESETTDTATGVSPRTSDSESVPTTSSVSAIVRRLVVGSADSLTEQDRDVRRFDSLEAAFRAAVDLPDVEAIELRFDGERTEEAFDISLASRKVTVRAGAGCRPVLRFEPSEADPVNDRRMIRIVHSSLTWEGVHFVLVLPPNPSDDWALFQLDRPGSLEWFDSTLTIRNVVRAGVPLHRAAFFQFSEPMAAETMMEMKGAKDTGMPSLKLQNCIVRGHATLVRCDAGLPFALSWDQGLFASTEGMIDIGGARTAPRPSDGISLQLSQLTAAIGQPLCVMHIEPEARFPLNIVSEATNCIFVTTHASVSGAPPLTLIERQHAPLMEQQGKRTFLRGSGNFYPNDTVLLRVANAGQPGGTVEYKLHDREKAREENWYAEQPSVGMVMWKRLPEQQVPVDQLTKIDFCVDDAPNNPARGAGFNPQLLPDAVEPPNNTTDE